MKDAIAKREINGLLGAISTAEDMKMASALTMAKKLVGRIEEEVKIIADLSKALKEEIGKNMNHARRKLKNTI